MPRPVHVGAAAAKEMSRSLLADAVTQLSGPEATNHQ
jgi:hypothetical protein